MRRVKATKDRLYSKERTSKSISNHEKGSKTAANPQKARKAT
jgi:hypothetical protein